MQLARLLALWSRGWGGCGTGRWAERTSGRHPTSPQSACSGREERVRWAPQAAVLTSPFLRLPQLISSDADGAIQRAGRFRVENGSVDEVGGRFCLQRPSLWPTTALAFLVRTVPGDAAAPLSLSEHGLRPGDVAQDRRAPGEPRIPHPVVLQVFSRKRYVPLSGAGKRPLPFVVEPFWAPRSPARMTLAASGERGCLHRALLRRWLSSGFTGVSAASSPVHQNYVGTDAEKNPFFLSVVLSDQNNQRIPQYRAILWRKTVRDQLRPGPLRLAG